MKSDLLVLRGRRAAMRSSAQNFPADTLLHPAHLPGAPMPAGGRGRTVPEARTERLRAAAGRWVPRRPRRRRALRRLLLPVGTLELGHFCLERRGREGGQSVWEKLTLPPPKAEAGDAETGWMFSLGAEIASNAFQRVPGCCCQISRRGPAERHKFYGGFSVPKLLVAPVPSSCAGGHFHT